MRFIRREHPYSRFLSPFDRGDHSGEFSAGPDDTKWRTVAQHDMAVDAASLSSRLAHALDPLAGHGMAREIVQRSAGDGLASARGLFEPLEHAGEVGG